MTRSEKSDNAIIPGNLEIENIIWNSGITHIAGVDEAGCGPLAGPVVAAVVIFPRDYYNPDIKDSKKLSAIRREELSEQIIQHARAYAVGIVHHAEIDRLNIRQATFKAMRKALGSLGSKPDYILFDGYELPEKLFPQEAIINGDNHSFTIAAASIVAKVTRDRLMLEYHLKYPLYGFDRNKGYGTAFHREMLKKHGPCPLHRRSFLSRILGQSES
ncbi:MAG: ribonuclease HII [Calditrichia bacterium]|jgi:ribonuclease HII|nr:ribonuclease HII [Calditrichia bacterium]MCK5117852.1 ribonuclease HII [Candidatus Aegiribacteria sp.]